MFKDLNVVGLGATAQLQPTLGSVLNPFNIVKNIRASRHPALRDILSGFEGVVRPGEMLRKSRVFSSHCHNLRQRSDTSSGPWTPRSRM